MLGHGREGAQLIEIQPAWSPGLVSRHPRTLPSIIYRYDTHPNGVLDRSMRQGLRLAWDNKRAWTPHKSARPAPHHARRTLSRL